MGEIEASIVTVNIIAVCIMIHIIHHKVIGSSVPLRVGCIKIVKS